MNRALVVISSDEERAKAVRWAQGVPAGSRIEFKPPKRTLPQNDRMWAMLTDVAAHMKKHSGRDLTTDQWKAVFLHAIGREVSFLPSLDGKTFIPWGQSSSDLGVKEMTDLIEFMFAWGAENGVIFNEPRDTHPGAADHQAPASDETPPSSSEQDGGDAPLSSPSNVSISDGLANPSVDGDGAVSSAPNAPSSSPISEDELKVLRRFASDILPRASRADSTSAQMSAIENRWAGDIGKLSEKGKDAARAISKSMRAVMEDPARIEGVLEHYAHVLECDVAEIGGAS